MSMNIIRVGAITSLLMISVFASTACGQRGDLYLPDKVNVEPAKVDKKQEKKKE